jgi:hypothetical protein
MEKDSFVAILRKITQDVCQNHRFSGVNSKLGPEQKAILTTESRLSVLAVE